MQRRDLLKLIAAATGLAMVGIEVYAAEGATATADPALQPKDIPLLDEIAETILPATLTPGAKAAGCGAVMARLVNDCYTPQHQQLLKDGLLQLRAGSRQQFGQEFLQLSVAERTAYLQSVDQQAKAGTGQSGAGQAGAGQSLHYFTLLKQLALFSFFSSEVGCTQVLRHVAVPGKYIGDLPYKKGDRAWALGG